jgi:hypothetical protein
LREINYLFKLPKIVGVGKLERDAFASAIITESKNEIGAFIGTPCVVHRQTYEKNSKSSVGTLFPFPFSSGKYPNSYYTLRKNQVKLIGKSFIKDHKIKTIKEFDLDKLEDLSEYIGEYGSITLRFAGPDCPYAGAIYAQRFVTETLLNLTERFDNHTVQEMNFYNNGSMPNFKDVSYHLTFLDIRYCLPIFSALKSVEGLCFVLRIGSGPLFGKIGKNADHVTLSMIFSNKLEGVFFVDGVQINNISKMSKMGVRNLSSQIGKILKGKNGKAEEKKEKKNSAEYIKYNPAGTVSAEYVTTSTTNDYQVFFTNS